jgi:hypothetical protein
MKKNAFKNKKISKKKFVNRNKFKDEIVHSVSLVKRHYSLFSSIFLSIYESFAFLMELLNIIPPLHTSIYIVDDTYSRRKDIRRIKMEAKGHEHHPIFSSNTAHNSSFIFPSLFHCRF